MAGDMSEPVGEVHPYEHDDHHQGTRNCRQAAQDQKRGAALRFDGEAGVDEDHEGSDRYYKQCEVAGVDQMCTVDRSSANGRPSSFCEEDGTDGDQ
jgi:hypothetical protein